MEQDTIKHIQTPNILVEFGYTMAQQIPVDLEISIIKWEMMDAIEDRLPSNIFFLEKSLP